MRNLIYSTIKTISFLSFILVFNFSFAQNSPSKVNDFKCFITSDIETSKNILEFDLYLLDSDSSTPFELASIQLGLLVNPAIYNDGDISVSFIDGSSELIDAQKPSSMVFSQTSNIIKIAARINNPVPGTVPPSTRGTIISAKYPGTRVCRIRLTNTKSFNKIPAYISFNFTKFPYPTTITQYISGINTALLCNTSNCYYMEALDLLK